MKTELSPIPRIRENLSWSELSQLPFSYRVNYWTDFLSSLDAQKMVEIDRVPPGSLRHRTPQMKLNQKIVSVRDLKPLNLPGVIPTIAGIDLPQLMLEAVPEAREASRYYILSEAKHPDIDKYHSFLGEFQKNKGDREFRNLINFIINVMPGGKTRSFLSDFMSSLSKNGDSS